MCDPIGTTDGSLKSHKMVNIFVSYIKFDTVSATKPYRMCIIVVLCFVLSTIRKLEFIRYFGTALVVVINKYIQYESC